MVRLSLQLSLLFSIFFITPLSLAQSVFNIEFIFFKRLTEQNSFQHLSTSNLPNIEQSFSLSSQDKLPTNYQLLSPKQKKLSGAFNKIKSSATMRPLAHLGWRQELANKNESPWLSFNVSDQGASNGLEDFSGMLRFSRNQGLLVENLILASGSRQSLLANEQQTQLVESEELLDQLPEDVHYVLSENRKIKLGQLHYFDHPAMGILVKVTPYVATLAEQKELE